MDGPAGGDLASALAIEHLAPLDADSHQAGELLGLLRHAVDTAHDDLVAVSSRSLILLFSIRSNFLPIIFLSVISSHSWFLDDIINYILFVP